ncbi:TIGR04086 family membrane protein [Halomonas alkalisoli]|uniref:TIGR04086 family membrane protein n=1 Tax=Halomonas alkalisoli TaxID=2907158 RepID=UPI001F2B261D|nr:TIGR04086 family membrane protein [Halomonas alkalisoli]MCE9682623.1 TIGR04086 family membrane protein [Halomonas alkalisoli]
MTLHLNANWRTIIFLSLLALAAGASAPPSSADERLLLDWDQAVERLRVTDLQGREITELTQPRQEQGRISVAVPESRAFVIKGDEIETLRVTSDEPLILPNGLVIPLPSPDTETEAETADRAVDEPSPLTAAWLRLTLAASPIPAVWNPLSGAYHTELIFGLQPSEERLITGLELEHPVEVRIRLRGLTIQDTLPPLRIDGPGLAHEQTLRLSFLPSTPNPTLEVRSTISDVNLELEVLPRLELRPASRRVLGLGLESVEVTLVRVAPHGMPLPTEQHTDVALTLDGGGRIETGAVHFAPGQATSSFSLRSSGLAPITVSAFTGSLSSETVIQQQFPWGPILAALFGGALGGYGRRFIKGARQALTRRRLVEGLLVASIAYVAGVLGVGYLGLPGAAVATEAGAFLTGALTGFIGVNVLEALSSSSSSSSSGHHRSH